MTKTTELAENYRQPFRGSGNHITSMDIREAYKEGAKDMLERVCAWLKFNTDWDMEWDECGRNLDFGKIDELRKDMEE